MLAVGVALADGVSAPIAAPRSGIDTAASYPPVASGGGTPTTVTALFTAGTGSVTNSGSPSVATPTTVSVGTSQLVVVAAYISATSVTFVSLTDNATGGSNTYTLLQPSSSSSQQVALFYTNTTNAMPTNTQWTATTSSGQYVILGAWSAPTTKTFDQPSTATGSGTSVSNGPTSALNGNSDLGFCAVRSNGGSNSTATGTFATKLLSSSNATVTYASPIGSSAVTCTMTLGAGVAWSSALATFF